MFKKRTRPVLTLSLPLLLALTCLYVTADNITCLPAETYTKVFGLTLVSNPTFKQTTFCPSFSSEYGSCVENKAHGKFVKETVRGYVGNTFGPFQK